MVPYASKCIHASENMLHVISDAQMAIKREIRIQFCNDFP